MKIEVEAWEFFKNSNSHKEKAKEIEALCREISAEWPAAVLPRKEKEETIKKIVSSEKFLNFKEEIEAIKLKTAFASSGDMGMLVLSQIIAAGSITR